jgi:hypothetical protein
MEIYISFAAGLNLFSNTVDHTLKLTKNLTDEVKGWKVIRLDG